MNPGAQAALSERRRCVLCLVAFASTVLAGAVAVAVAVGAGVGQKTIFETRSAYNHIIVKEDDEGLRYLLFSETGGYQSVRKPGDAKDLELPYSRSMLAGLGCVDDPRSILVIGLGGGSIPSFLHSRFPKAKIDCVDIDPEVISVAKKYFGFKEDELLRVHAGDGRKFVEESRDRYDLIFLDAYGNDFIPRHLATRQFLEATKRILAPRGVILGNIWGRRSNTLYDSMLATYKAVFDEVYLFYVPARENIIFLGIPRPEKVGRDELARRAGEVGRNRGFPFDLEELVRYGYRDAREVEVTDPVLEDEKKPEPEAKSEAAEPTPAKGSGS